MLKFEFLLLIAAFFTPRAFAAPTCASSGYYHVTKDLCCPAGAVLNRQGKCYFPTKNGCPSGQHPEPSNSCCPDGSVLTPDGYCTEMGGGGEDTGNSGPVSVPDTNPQDNSYPAPAWYPSNASDTCPYGQCTCQGYAQNGNVVGQGQTCN